MEMFVRYVLFFIAPVVQIMLSVWRVQGKIRLPLGAIIFIAFLLSIGMIAIAVSIFPNSLSPCMGCAMSYGRPNSLWITALGLMISIGSNLLISIIAFVQFRAARH
jgi:hypothetical protein